MKINVICSNCLFAGEAEAAVIGVGGAETAAGDVAGARRRR